MKNWTSRIIFFLTFFAIIFFIGKNIYYYHFDLSYPKIYLNGIEDEKYYSNILNFFIDVEDEYKVKNISVFLDEKPIVNKLSINNSSYSYPLSIPTNNIENGSHYLKVIAVDSSKKSNTTTKVIKFYIDNNPLEVSFIDTEVEKKVFQGNTLHLTFQANKNNVFGCAKTLSYEVPCVLESDRSRVYECFIPISTDEIPNEYIVRLNLEDAVGNKAVLEKTYQVVSQNFKKEKVNIVKKLDTENAKSGEELNKILEELSKNSPKKKLWSGKFYAPCLVKSITTQFGVVRTSMERGRYKHDAIDFYATPKSPVWASQDGIIAVKDNFLYTGNTIVIDHGCGIITLYAHLDSFSNIEVGQNIKKGNIIGTVGMTGYSTGYHLHFELRILNIPINPIEWIKEDI